MFLSNHQEWSVLIFTTIGQVNPYNVLKWATTQITIGTKNLMENLLLGEKPQAHPRVWNLHYSKIGLISLTSTEVLTKYI